MKDRIVTIRLTEEKVEKLITILHENCQKDIDAVEIANDICAQLYNRPTDTAVYVSHVTPTLLREHEFVLAGKVEYVATDVNDFDK